MKVISNQHSVFSLRRALLGAFVVGAVGLGFCVLGIVTDRHQFFISYLFAYLFWLGLALGCFSVTMIHHLTGGRWGYPTRRFLEAGMGTLPAMALLFIPIFFVLSELFPWARPDVLARDETLQRRHDYMNAWAFGARSVFFLALWNLMAWYLRKWSLEQDQTPDAAPTRKLRTLSGPGIVIFPVTATFACVDWIMSTEAHWYSTMFAVIVLIGQILLAYSSAVILMTLFKRSEPLAEAVTTTHYHHLGNLLLTFVMFWTYVSFGQLLVIYSGNLPHEIEWYLHRIAGNWIWVVGVLALFHFFLPFFLLLFRAIKQHVAPLTTLAVILFLAHVVNVYWLVTPSFHQTGIRIRGLDFAAFFGIGGAWAALFLAQLKSAPLLPLHDPGQQFAFSYARAH